MELLEIVLLVGGILCIIASFLIGEKEQDKALDGTKTTELTEQDKEYVRKQIEALIEEQMGDVSERTEAALDKISNTKILEMNDYAETVMGEINRNHNETVFLYDMLNEKAKEVKSTVKDVNIAKRQASANNTGISASSTAVKLDDGSKTQIKESVHGVSGDNRADNKDMARERLVELVKKSTERSRDMQGDSQSKTQTVDGASEKESKSGNNKSSKKSAKQGGRDYVTDKNLQQEIAKIKNDSGAGKNDVIIAMHKLGLSNRDIAKELNLGVGEVNLVIGLFSSDK